MLPAWDLLHWSNRQSALIVAIIIWPQKEHLCSLKMAEFQSIKWLVHDNCTKWIRAVELHHKEHDNDPYPLHKNTINYFLCIYRQAVDYGIWICTGSYQGLRGERVNMLIFFDLLLKISAIIKQRKFIIDFTERNTPPRLSVGFTYIKQDPSKQIIE